MERVVFILEETNERLPCMLNPESVLVERDAGVANAATLGATLSNGEQKDDPVLWRGGGRTQISLNLLFDVGLLIAERAPPDVRDLTRPLHELSESRNTRKSGKMPPLVRFIWGKAWNIRCIVGAVAERFEQFNSSGIPRRSWMSMRLLRVAGDAGATKEAPPPRLPLELREPETRTAAANLPVHEVTGQDAGGGARLDVVAHERYGNAGHWRTIAAFNGIEDPLHIPAGTQLRMPPGGRT